MQKTRKPLSLLLTLCMILSLFAGLTFSVSADEGQTVTKATLLEDGATYLITATYGGTTYALSADSASTTAVNPRKAEVITIADGKVTAAGTILWKYTTAGGFVNQGDENKVLRMGSGVIYTNGSATTNFVYDGETLSAEITTATMGKIAAKVQLATQTINALTAYCFTNPGGSASTTGTMVTQTIILYKVVTEAAHEHSYTETVTTPATCGTAGLKTFTCECGDSYTQEIPATGNHTYVDGVCSVCGAEETTGGETGGDKTCDHSYTAVNNGDGTHTWKCSKCGAEKSDAGNALGDTVTEFTPGKRYVITGNGMALSNEDNPKNDSYRKAPDFTVGDAITDSIIWEYTSNGYLKNGDKYLNNTSSGSLYIFTALADTGSTVWSISNGYLKSSNSTYLWLNNNIAMMNSTQSDCTPVTVYEVVAAGPTESHTYTETIIKAVTCKENGSKLLTCTACGATETETIVSTGEHEYTPVPNDDGTTHTWKCLGCDREREAGYTVSEKAYTVLSDGKKYVIVTANNEALSCNTYESDANYLAGVAWTGAATDDLVWNVRGSYLGSKNGDLFVLTSSPYTLSVSTQTRSVAYISTGYLNINGRYLENGTTGRMGTNGSKSYATKVSAYEVTELFTTEDHNFDSSGKCIDCGYQCNHEGTLVTDDAVPATCTATGLTEGQHCSVCGCVTVTQDVVPMIDHNYVNDICTVCGAMKPHTKVSVELTDQLKPGKMYLIVSDDGKYAMSVEDGYNTNYRKAIALTVNDGVATAASLPENINELIWTVEEADGGVKLRSGKLYLTASFTYLQAKETPTSSQSNIWSLNSKGVLRASSTSTYCVKNATSYGFTNATNSSVAITLYEVSFCDHMWSETGTYVDPTCTERGYTVYPCTKCDKTKTVTDETEAGNPRGHEDAKEPYTDNGDGTHLIKCTRSGCAGYYEAHSYDPATGKCVCGVVEPLTIGEGASSGYTYPFYTSYRYVTEQMIYKAADIGKAGTITSIAFNVATASEHITDNVKIYMAHTTLDKFSAKTDYQTAGLTLVYDGSPELAKVVGWDELKLNKADFEYNGTDNLLVTVIYSAEEKNTTLKYAYDSTSDSQLLYGGNNSDEKYADISKITPSSMNIYSRSCLPQLQLRITEAPAAVAKIGDQTYTSLKAAVAAAKDGDTVTLLADTTEGFAFSKSITLDLGGKKLTGIPVGDETMALQISAGKVTVQNGTVAGRVNVYDDADVTIAEKLTITNSGTDDATAYGIVVYGEGKSGETGCKTPTLNFYGTIKVTGNAIGITTNGLDESAPVINVYPGAVITADENGTGIYLPAGTLTVTGGTVTGATAIYFKSTNMTISGGTFSGIGKQAEYKFNGNGLDATGDAIVIDNCNYPNGTGTIAITGGSFSSKNAQPVASYAGNGQETALTGFVSGGTFNKAIDNALCASGFECVENENGSYGVEAASVEVFELKATDDGNGTITVEVIAKRNLQFSAMQLYLRCSYGKATLTSITGAHVDELVNLKTGFAGLYAVEVDSFTVAKGEVLATCTYTYDAEDGEDFRFRLSTGECYLGTEYEDELPWSKDYASLPEEERPAMPKVEVGDPGDDPTGFNVTVDDRTKGTATVNGIEATMSGEISFTVANDKACVVLVRTGEEGSYTYTRLTATAVENAENKYSFTTNVTGDITIIVAIKGDVSGNGKIDSADVSLIKMAYLGKKGLTGETAVIADVSGNSKIDSADVSLIKMAYTGKRALTW